MRSSRRCAERGAELYRDLPWRNIDDPYGVLVSEVMLQQTQVARVMRYWERWMGLFPTVDALAAADTATVLDAWQGLGYNRRALALKRACEQCSAENGGHLPRTVDELVKLPGIGPATAAGVVAFAYDEPAVYIETNVRSVFLHELFPEARMSPTSSLRPTWPIRALTRARAAGTMPCSITAPTSKRRWPTRRAVRRTTRVKARSRGRGARSAASC